MNEWMNNCTTLSNYHCQWKYSSHRMQPACLAFLMSLILILVEDLTHGSSRPVEFSYSSTFPQLILVFLVPPEELWTVHSPSLNFRYHIKISYNFELQWLGPKRILSSHYLKTKENWKEKDIYRNFSSPQLILGIKQQFFELRAMGDVGREACLAASSCRALSLGN